MRTLRNIFGNVSVLLGIAAFAASLAILWRHPGFGREDAIGGLIIFGIAFPLLAWVTTLRARPLELTVRRSSAEMWLLFACLVAVTRSNRSLAELQGVRADLGILSGGRRSEVSGQYSGFPLVPIS